MFSPLSRGDVIYPFKGRDIITFVGEVQFISNVYEGNYEGTKGKGYMTPFSKDMITDNTKTLTLTPFVSTDIVKDNRHIRGELIPAGEAFTIELQ